MIACFKSGLRTGSGLCFKYSCSGSQTDEAHSTKGRAYALCTVPLMPQGIEVLMEEKVQLSLEAA